MQRSADPRLHKFICPFPAICDGCKPPAGVGTADAAHKWLAFKDKLTASISDFITVMINSQFCAVQSRTKASLRLQLKRPFQTQFA